jgi:hypothetical protein
MCHAITKSGKRCKVKGGNYFCHIHIPYVEPTIEEKREAMLQKLLNNHLQPQVEALPLFQGVDLTSEAIDIINRAKHVCDVSDEAYDNVISSYLNDGIDNIRKYNLIRDMIAINIQLNPTKDSLKKIQRVDLIGDATMLYIKFALSRGIFWQGLEEARRMYMYKLLPKRETLVNKYRENQLNKLRVIITKKHTPICDDVCNYIIAKYL